MSWNEYVRLCLSFAVFTRNEDTGWTVEIPVKPGCVSWGDTRADAAVMAEDAIHGWLVTALRFGDDVPEIGGNGLGFLAKVTSDSEGLVRGLTRMNADQTIRVLSVHPRTIFRIADHPVTSHATGVHTSPFTIYHSPVRMDTPALPEAP